MFSCNSYIVSSNELYVYVYVYVDVLMLLVDAYVYVYVHVQGIVSEGCIRIRCSTTTCTLLRFTFLLVTSLFFDVESCG